MSLNSYSNRKSKLMARAAALALIAGGFSAAEAQSSEPIEFNLAEQSLDAALKEFGIIADAQVMFTDKVVAGKTANAVTGDLPPMQALDQLLQGSGLTYDVTSSNIILIKAADQRASAGQPFRVAQALDGENDDAPQQTNEEPIEVDTIIVTGTNIRGVENPTTPVIQFDREDIEFSGATTVEEFLRTIPQNFSSLDSAVSGQSGDPFNGVGQNSTNGTAINLRGVGLGATLTLLNGRRLPNASGFSGSFVDVSLLPIDVIERVDVQTDGASAVYGSDAVGGVVNFITSREYDGAQLSTRYGFAHGGGEEFQGSFTGGRSWSSGNVLVNLTYADRNPLSNSDRSFIDLDVAEGDASLINEEERFNSYMSASQDIGERLSVAVDFLYSQRDTISVLDSITADSETSDANIESLILNARVDYQLSDNLTAEFFIDYADETSEFLLTSDVDPSLNETTSDLFSVEGTFSGTLFSLPAGPLAFALGGSYREENRERNLDGEFLNTLSADRSITAAYAELLVPLVSTDQSLPFIEQLDLSVAGRYEDYSDFGDTFNPKIGLHWKPTEALAFRGTYSESFRAPPLARIVPERDVVSMLPLPASLFSDRLGVGDLPQDDRLPPGTVSLLNFSGSDSLTEETAVVWSGGLTYTPKWLDRFTFDANYFDISYDNRIESVGLTQIIFEPAFSGLFSVNPSASLLAPLFARQDELGANFRNFLPFDPTPADIQVAFGPSIVNLSRREVSGVDFVGSYDIDVGAGDLSTSINATIITDYIAQLTPDTIATDQAGTLYRPPALRLRGDVSYSLDGFSAFAAVNYIDDYQDVIDSSVAQSINSWTTVDLTIAYDTGQTSTSGVLSNIRTSLSIVNLFDEEPPFVETRLDGLNFDSANANGIGRFITFNVSKRL